jgi:tetratricopeptide (TPR) repeat protein
VERLADWWKREPSCAAGAAGELLGLDEELEALVAFLSGAYHNDHPKLERALTLAPDSVAVELCLAGAVGKTDKAASRAIYERVLARMRAGEAPPPSPAAALIARVEAAPSSAAGVINKLAMAAYEEGDRPRAIELADELVKLDPDSMDGWQIRGHARLFELRYAEAAEAYAEGIREIDRIREEGDARGTIYFGKDPRATMHFNRACAFGRLEKKEEALDALRRAVRADEKYAEEARTEEWIACLWGTPELEAIARMDPRALATREELEKPFVQRLASRCKGHFYRGEPKQALEAGERAVQLAEIIGDAELSADAFSALGYALAFSGSAGRAVELMAKAVTIAEEAPLPARAEAVATQAVVLQAHGDLDGAERAHRLALDLRRRAHGEEAPILAKSYGDLARLHAEQGRPGAEVRAEIERGIRVLARFLDGHEARDDEWAEAVTDRATLEVNLAQALAGEGMVNESVSALEAAAGTFTAAAEGTSLNARVLENAGALAERLGVWLPAARKVAERLEGLRYPGSPAERRERVLFGKLRRFVERMRASGAEDGSIAEILHKAARSAAELPEGLREVPELASFSGELAARAARHPTFLVTSVMALQLAATDLDGSLHNLEELCVAMALEAEAG